MTRPIIFAALVAALATAGLTTSPAHAATAGCSWLLKSDSDTINTASPDQAATYWATELPPVAQTRVKITGRFPHARYFSFHVYDADERPVGKLGDYEVVPDAGSRNPFADPDAHAGGTYTAHVVFEDPPADAAPNTIYAGSGKSVGAMIYRVYVPDDPDSEAGSVPLPTVTLETAAGREIVTLAHCPVAPPSTGGVINDTINGTAWPSGAPTPFTFPNASDPPAFSRPGGGADGPGLGAATALLGFFPNEDNKYLKMTLSRDFGNVVALRFRAMTFPDTRSGERVTKPSDVRYWSLCMYEFESKRYVRCSADHQTLVAKDGLARFVIADPGNRPAGADRAHGLNFLPWPGAYYDGYVLFRNMLPSPTFRYSVEAVPGGAKLAGQMGDYGPVARYCRRATIEHDGVDACFG